MVFNFSMYLFRLDWVNPLSIMKTIQVRNWFSTDISPYPLIEVRNELIALYSIVLTDMEFSFVATNLENDIWQNAHFKIVTMDAVANRWPNFNISQFPPFLLPLGSKEVLRYNMFWPLFSLNNSSEKKNKEFTLLFLRLMYSFPISYFR